MSIYNREEDKAVLDHRGLRVQAHCLVASCHARRRAPAC